MPRATTETVVKGLNYGLTAKNSESDLRLFVDKQDEGEIHLAIAGTHEGQYLQIDFDDLDVREAQDLADFIRDRATATRRA